MKKLRSLSSALRRKPSNLSSQGAAAVSITKVSAKSCDDLHEAPSAGQASTSSIVKPDQKTLSHSERCFSEPQLFPGAASSSRDLANSLECITSGEFDAGAPSHQRNRRLRFSGQSSDDEGLPCSPPLTDSSLEPRLYRGSYSASSLQSYGSSSDDLSDGAAAAVGDRLDHSAAQHRMAVRKPARKPAQPRSSPPAAEPSRSSAATLTFITEETAKQTAIASLPISEDIIIKPANKEKTSPTKKIVGQATPFAISSKELNISLKRTNTEVRQETPSPSKPEFPVQLRKTTSKGDDQSPQSEEKPKILVQLRKTRVGEPENSSSKVPEPAPRKPPPPVLKKPENDLSSRILSSPSPPPPKPVRPSQEAADSRPRWSSAQLKPVTQKAPSDSPKPSVLSTASTPKPEFTAKQLASTCKENQSPAVNNHSSDNRKSRVLEMVRKFQE